MCVVWCESFQYMWRNQRNKQWHSKSAVFALLW